MGPNMKRFLLIAAAVGLLASPVIAQTQPGAKTVQQKAKAAEKVKKTGTANDVYCGGKYLGSDPDATVRDQIKRDFGHECN